MKTNAFSNLIRRLALCQTAAIMAWPACQAQAGGLTSGEYQFQIPVSPVHLHGAYPITVGTMTTDCVLSLETSPGGVLSGGVDIRTLKQTITGELASKDGVITMHVHIPKSADLAPASDLNAQLKGRQFVGTAQDSTGSVLFTMDVSSTASLWAVFDLHLTVDGAGKISGNGNASVPGLTLPVTVTGTNSANNCSLHIAGTNLPQFSWDGSGPPTYIGFTASYTFAGFGASKSGNGLLVGHKATAPALLGNISTRLVAQTGDNVLIGGFIVTGTQQKKVIVRAIGPSLPLAGKLADPKLDLYDSSGKIVASNDNWMDAPNRQAIIDSTIPPTNDNESAILTSLAPGAYTAIVSGVGNTTGIAVVEVYDLDRTVDSRLANISTRGLVQTGDNVLIGGFIVLGADPQRVLVRAIGPSLAVANRLTDPTLELHDPNGGLLASNDNWISDQGSEILATEVAPKSSKESAIVATLLPGPFTAVVRGANGTTGIAVVEAYGLNP